MSSNRSRRTALAVVAAVLAGLALTTYLIYRPDAVLAYARISTARKIAQTRGGRVEYAVPGQGPPFLVVHGAGGGLDRGTDLGGSLPRNGFRVIAPSRVGDLRTPLPADASAAAQADAHACLLDVLGIRRAAVVGFSAGAPSSLQLALRHPERCAALVLVLPGAYVPRAGGRAA